MLHQSIRIECSFVFLSVGAGKDDSSSDPDYSELDEEEPRPKKMHRVRPKLANLFNNGNQGAKAGPAAAGAASGAEDNDMAASDLFWHSLTSKKVCRRALKA